jgi:ATP-dependent Clp protease ATP-binding subunit ClpA
VLLDVEQRLAARLKQLNVHVDSPDGDTILLRSVPISTSFFNKARTNLLIKRAREGMPYLVCVDEDLEYIGGQQLIARAFAGARRQQGWRAITFTHRREARLQDVIEQALAAIGFDGQEPKLVLTSGSVEDSRPARLLDAFSRQLGAGDEPTIGRQDEIEQVVSCLLQWRVQMPLIVGESGVGKSNLLQAAARRLCSHRPNFKVLVVAVSELMAGTLFDCDRENVLIELLKEAVEQKDTIVALENLEYALVNVPRGHLLLSQAIDRGARLIGTTLTQHAPLFEVAPLAIRVQRSELPEMTFSEVTEVLESVRDRISKHHQVSIPESLLEAVIETSADLDGRMPAKAIALLDRASARASLLNATELSSFELFTAATQCERVEL